MSGITPEHIGEGSNVSEVLEESLVSPVSPPMTSSSSGYFSFDTNALLLGGLGVARESRARWSSVDHDSHASKSPLERLGFKLSLGDKKTRDGQAPKRRGPKPDSKPALTRRQELNRQAQRTHRERKELYIKALEQEVLRLKEAYQQNAQEKEHFADENRVLKDLLQAHGIPYDSNLTASLRHSSAAGSQYGGSSSSATRGHTQSSVSTGVTSPTNTGPLSIPNRSAMGSPATSDPAMMGTSSSRYQPNRQQGIDYDQVGIDFVLQLEKPCQDHMQMLLVRSEDSDGEISGHVLMATCPPHSHILNKPDEKYPHKVFDLFGPDLQALYNLSAPLPMAECEVPPIRAWAMIRSHPRFEELTKEDCLALRDELGAKIRCYGFGAVLEDFEVADALNNVFVKKGELDLNELAEMSMDWSPPPGLESFQR